ncbi:MAG: carboxypeptidase-like regulatory domain-containing protein [Verrucomicrobiota bacterium]
MKKHIYSSVSRFVTIICLSCGLSVEVNSQTNLSQNDPWSPMMSTNTPPPGFKTRLEYIKSFKEEKAIYEAARAGLINKDEMITALSMHKFSTKNKRIMNTYGKVVDQYGNPVAGAIVHGFLEFAEQLVKSERHNTMTDQAGLFSFTGLHGSGFGIALEKAGFDYNLMRAIKRKGVTH